MALSNREASRQARWHNWSGSVRATPRQIVKPGSITGLVRMIEQFGREGRQVRVVGSGHSFTPLAQTGDILMSLDDLQGVDQVDAEHGRVTVLGGTKLKQLGDVLFAHGLAQENLGDINVQSIAGAISTGTHGTGVRFGSLATQVEGLTLVTASGELLECLPGQNAEIFKAAQVSLGTLGVIAKVTLRVVPAKRLHYVGQRKKLADCLDHLEQYRQENSHFEFFWFPYTEWVQAKFLNETDEPSSKNTLWSNFNKIVLENWVYWLLSECCRVAPDLSKTACHISAASISHIDEVNYSHLLYSTPRMVRFQEMEYNIPAEHTRAVITEIQECINREQFQVHFPIECRFVHRDDIWLSPAYERDSAYIAVHMYRGMPYQSYFEHIEEIFRRYDGRPHWGKMHTRTAEELAGLYPRWHDFRRIRARLDPQGMFLNDYLRKLFDTAGSLSEEAARTQQNDVISTD
ncbi:MAG TPA: D-arabinono-1,4-lactone oxidase [Ktedonobacteraceae bacterium]|jgi:FAD-linked oxidoreductase|nr:D-arabinono-1,4-lactone oxidase [Ktedonobacteraceae bacterium]